MVGVNFSKSNLDNAGNFVQAEGAFDKTVRFANFKKRRPNKKISYRNMAELGGPLHKKVVWAIHRNKGKAVVNGGSKLCKKQISITFQCCGS